MTNLMPTADRVSWSYLYVYDHSYKWGNSEDNDHSSQNDDDCNEHYWHLIDYNKGK